MSLTGTFGGKDLLVTWTRNPANNVPGIVLRDYEVLIYLGLTLIRTDYTTSPTYTYYYDDMITDQNGSPSRTVTVSVAERDTFLRKSAYASATFTNPKPAAPTFELKTAFKTVAINISPVSDSDVDGYMVFRGTTSGFTADSSSLIYKGRDIQFVDSNLTDGVTYWYKVAAFDLFDDTIAGATISSALSATTPSVTSELVEYDFQNITFTTSSNTVTWTGGTVIRTAGSTVTTNSVSGGNATYTTTPLYIYYDHTTTSISSTTSLTTALGAVDRRILATYKGGSNLINGVNEPIIDGSKILVNTVGAGQIIAGSIGTNQLSANSITGEKIQAGTISTDKLEINNTGFLNSIINGDFAFSDLRGWTTSNANWATVDRANSVIFASPYRTALRMLQDNSDLQLRSSFIPVTANDSISIIMKAYAVGSARFDVNVEYYTVAGALLSTVFKPIVLINDQWLDIKLTDTVPTDAFSCKLYIKKIGLTAMPLATGDVYLTDVRLTSARAASTVIAAGTIVNELIQTGSLNANIIGTGVLNARFINVDETLSLSSPTAGFSAGKLNAEDFLNDGFFLGRDAANDFGLLVGRTRPSGLLEYLQLTPSTGLILKNPTFKLNSGTATSVFITSTSTVNIPTNATNISLTIIGGGGGGGNQSAGGAGGTTTVLLYDNNTNTGVSWSGLGGAGGAAGTAIGGTSPPPALPGTPSVFGAYPNPGSGGNGGTWEANDRYRQGFGGGAATPTYVTSYDIAALVLPNIRVTIGTGGAAGGGNRIAATTGAAGAVLLTYDLAADIDASIIAKGPTAFGTFAVGSGTSGSFPSTGVNNGMWVLNNVPNGMNIRISLANNRLINPIAGNTMTFVANQPPNWSTASESRTITYAFYAMSV